MKETLQQTKKMFSDYVSSTQKDDEDPYMQMSSVKKMRPGDGQEQAAPGVGQQCQNCRRDFENYHRSLYKQVEMIYNELQRLGQVVRMSKPTAIGSKLASKTNSALPSHRGVYIEVGFKGATEVINDLSQRFLVEQAKFRDANRSAFVNERAEKNHDPGVNVIGFMLAKMAESNEYTEQLIQ